MPIAAFLDMADPPTPWPHNPASPRLRRSAAQRAALAIAAICALGAALRVVAADGPLWNDEIWSLLNLRSVAGPGDILWGISHDNNHFQTSLWLWLAYPASPDPLWLRLPSLIAGAVAIPVTAQIALRRSLPAAVAAAALTALSFFQITYSAEARGYAPATLALLFAYLALERGLEAPRSEARWGLAAAAGVGLFCHLALGPAIVLLGAVGFAESWRRSGSLAAAARATFALFWPAALAMVPTVLCVAAGYLRVGGFTIGLYHAFTPGRLVSAAVNLEMATFGLSPQFTPAIAFALLVLPILVAAAIWRLAAPERRIAYVVMIFALPALAYAFRVPNTHTGRYFFAASPFLLLLAADAFDAGWRRAGPLRIAAVLALGAALVADASAFMRLERAKAATWSDALALVAASAEPTLVSSYDFNVGKSVEYFNRTHDGAVSLLPLESLCDKRPAWYVLEMQGPEVPPAEAKFGEPCRLSFQLEGVFDRDIPSQPPWALYRAVR